ncbi:MAG: hypothetical protein WCW52_06890 [Elusimicrobiales bacterium]
MNISRSRLVMILIALFGLCAGSIAYMKYRRFSSYLIDRINSQAGRKLGRQVKFKRISFAPLEGVVIDGPCVSRAPDFTKGNFFCAERAVIRPELAPLMKNRLYFASVKLEKPVIKIRETRGKWDFEDLLALLPKTSKGLYLTWNAKTLAMKDASLEIDLDSSGDSIALENADISLLHYSALAGNFSLKINGAVKTVLKGQLAAANAVFKTDLNFEYAGLTSAFGGMEMTEAAMGASTLKKASLNWELFNIDRPAPEKNYTAGFKAEGLSIPAQSCGAAQAVNSAMELLSEIMGRKAPRCEDIELDLLALDLALKDGVLRVKRFDLDTNFLDAAGRYELNGPARTVDLEFAAASGDNKLALTAKGPMSGPEILPAMSATLNRKLTEVIKGINAALLRLFPVDKMP